MVTIGTFKKTTDGFTGTIKTLSLNVKASIRPSEKENDEAPDFRVYIGTVEIGACWKQAAAAEREYVSCKLDDPSFPAPIYASLIGTNDSEAFSLIWSR